MNNLWTLRGHFSQVVLSKVVAHGRCLFVSKMGFHQPFDTWKFCRLMLFEASLATFWPLRNQKEPTLFKALFASQAKAQLLFLTSNYSFQRSGMRRRKNWVFGLKSFTAPSTFTFRFLSSLLLVLFFPYFFLLLGIHYASILREKFLQEARGSWNYFEGSTSGWWDKIFNGIF